MVKLGDQLPNFEVTTTEGNIQFHQWLNGKWGILFSHPDDYTPVCTTELGRAAKLAPEFEKRGVKLIGLSCNSTDSHHGWIKDIQAYNDLKGAFPFPIIADPDRDLAVQLGMLDPVEQDKQGLPLTCRAVFIVDENAKVKLSLLYPATTGRNFDEILRVVDSLKLTVEKKVATPVDWKAGEKCMVIPSVKPADIPNLFPKGVEIANVPSGKQYIRLTPQP